VKYIYFKKKKGVVCVVERDVTPLFPLFLLDRAPLFSPSPRQFPGPVFGGK